MSNAQILSELHTNCTYLPFFEAHIPAGFPSPALDHMEQKLSLDELLDINTPHTYVALVFDYLIERDPRYTRNPVHGIKRPRTECYEGKTPALSSAQAKLLLDAPNLLSAKGLRDRAILAVLLYHGLRRQEVASLRVCDLQKRDGLLHLRIHGKGSRLRYIPLHGDAENSINQYLGGACVERDKKTLCSPAFGVAKLAGA